MLKSITSNRTGKDKWKEWNKEGYQEAKALNCDSKSYKGRSRQRWNLGM
jgi:hypothetical protein